MTRARALVAAVPPRVWTAVAGLVLLASLGVSVVLGAGLSTWQGAVRHTPGQPGARSPATVVAPPGSAVVVVPTPTPARPHPGPQVDAAPPGVGPPAPSRPAHVSPPSAPAGPAVAPPVEPAAVGPVTTARPRTTAVTTARHGHGHRGHHGKHLGWSKGARGAAHASGDHGHRDDGDRDDGGHGDRHDGGHGD